VYTSAYQLSLAASQIRSSAAAMNTIVSDMQAASTWNGTDADRFAQDWTDQVMTPLYRAAGRLDVIDFVPAGE
jgi:hypothetical protein